MKLNKQKMLKLADGRASLERLLLGVIACASAACSSSGSTPTLPPSCTPTASANVVTAADLPAAAANVMSITINGSQCSQVAHGQYPNEPCATITVCTPGNASQCTTIPNLLVDTGSYGIRFYASLLGSVVPGAVAGDTGALAECVGFGDGSSEWGKVGTLDVTLGGETPISALPVMLINSTYATPPTACSAANSTPDTSPASTGFNGIIGVGLLDKDCGNNCANSASNGQYYSCSGTTCTRSKAALASQVRNPVAALSTDNNGVVMVFPSIPDTGAASVTGAMILGINTRANNVPANVKTYPADSFSTFTSVFNPFSAQSLVSFIDSGSSLLFFPWPPPSDATLSSIIPDCGGGLAGFYCPASTQTMASNNIGNGGSPTSCVPFNVGNASSLIKTGNMVFSNLTGGSGSDTSADFDWGLPFFLGRKVYVGITGKAATGLGTGPFWAY